MVSHTKTAEMTSGENRAKFGAPLLICLAGPVGHRSFPGLRPSCHVSHCVCFVGISLELPPDTISAPKEDKRLTQDCGNVDDDDDDDMEQEEMFVEADESLGHGMPEWGGPRRGGRLPEPTRFGDWERKGRCTDF